MINKGAWRGCSDGEGWGTLQWKEDWEGRGERWAGVGARETFGPSRASRPNVNTQILVAVGDLEHPLWPSHHLDHSLVWTIHSSIFTVKPGYTGHPGDCDLVDYKIILVTCVILYATRPKLRSRLFQNVAGVEINKTVLSRDFQSL